MTEDRTIDPDWITVTVAASGVRKPMRRSMVASFGTLQTTIAGEHSRHTGYIHIGGNTIQVRETEAELARLLHAPRPETVTTG